jgi:hypothetical protein
MVCGACRGVDDTKDASLVTSATGARLSRRAVILGLSLSDAGRRTARLRDETIMDDARAGGALAGIVSAESAACPLAPPFPKSTRYANTHLLLGLNGGATNKTIKPINVACTASEATNQVR